MFIGHHAAGFAAKRLAPRVSLGVLFAGAMLLDLIWPFLTLGGFEHFRIDPGNTAFTPLDFYDYPISHSLVSVIGWALAAMLLWRLVARAEPARAWREGGVIALAVLSHWVLDFLTHAPDLELWPGGPKTGLALWNSVPATIAVEVLLFSGALLLYVRATEPVNRRGSISLWLLVGFVGLIYAANIVSPPPPSWQAVSYSAIAAWLFVPWGWWIDRNRRWRD
jgi:hypothetical protein